MQPSLDRCRELSREEVRQATGRSCTFRRAFGGNASFVQIRKLIERRIRRSGRGVDVDADVNAVVAANVGERGAVTHASSKQTAAAVSRPARAERDDA